MGDIDNYREPRYEIRGDADCIVGKTPVMLDLFYKINQLAPKHTTVLIRGETGTGKELVAKALHYNGFGARKPLVAVDCASIPSELLESTLFGHVKGAFTGAYQSKQGLIAEANGGTLFLDEIGEMPPQMQSKLLRFLQEREVRKVGSNEHKRVDVRIVAATNRDLEEEIRVGRFKKDLFYRLNVFPLHLPPLRERKDDIPAIVDYLVAKFNRAYSAEVKNVSETVKSRLFELEWDGNVRELENLVERAFVLKQSGELKLSDFMFAGPAKKSAVAAASVSMVRDDNAWYCRGVMPLLMSELLKVEGTKSRPSFHRVVDQNKVYSEKLGEGQQGGRVVYLTSESLPHFFSNTHTDGYRRLMSGIETCEFNRLIGRPFKVYGLSSLAAKCGISPNDARDAVFRLKPYVVSDRAAACFVLTEELVDALVPSGPDKEGVVKSLLSDLKENYERFRQWNPLQYGYGFSKAEEQPAVQAP